MTTCVIGLHLALVFRERPTRRKFRDALWERIKDSYEDARMEAFIGLGKRNDNRIIPMLLSVFSKNEVLQGYIEASELILKLDSADCQHWKLSDYVERLRSLMNDSHLS